MGGQAEYLSSFNIGEDRIGPCHQHGPEHTDRSYDSQVKDSGNFPSSLSPGNRLFNLHPLASTLPWANAWEGAWGPTRHVCSQKKLLRFLKRGQIEVKGLWGSNKVRGSVQLSLSGSCSKCKVNWRRMVWHINPGSFLGLSSSVHQTAWRAGTYRHATVQGCCYHCCHTKEADKA